MPSYPWTQHTPPELEAWMEQHHEVKNRPWRKTSKRDSKGRFTK